jgi:hypothetical protein
MTIKLKFEVDNIKVGQDTTDPRRGVLRLAIKGGYLLGHNGTNPLAWDANINKKGGGTKKWNEINFVKINCSLGDAVQAARLIKFRDKIKDASTDAHDINKWVIFLNGVDGGDDNNTLTLGGTNDEEIQLNDADFGGTFDLSKIDIGAADTSSGNQNDHWTPHAYKDFNAERTAWQKLEDDLIAIKGKYNLTTNLQTADIAADINLLNAYWVAQAGGTNPGDEQKKSLYELDGVRKIGSNGKDKNGKKFYQRFIDSWIGILSELELWKVGGFDTVEEVLKANANGFIINRRSGGTAIATIGKSHYGDGIIEKQADGTTARVGVQANRNKIKSLIKNKKFGGFAMFDAGQTKAATVTDQSKSLFGAEYAAKTDLKPTAKQLITFYSKNWFGEDHDGVNYLDKDASDPRNFRGFKPTDMLTTTNMADVYGGHGQDMSDAGGVVAGKRITKIAKDIWYAPSLQEAIDLAFFGKHYFVDNPSGLTNKNVRLDERYKGGNDKCLLYFNEVSGLNEKDTLDLYYDTLKSLQCGGSGGSVYNKTDNELRGGTEWSTDNYHADNVKTPKGPAVKKVDDGYNVVKTFLDAYLAAKGESDDANRKAAGEKLKTDYNISGTPAAGSDDEMKKKLYDHWKTKIDELITGTPQNDLQTKLDEAKNDHKEKEYEELWKNSNGDITKDNVDEIIELVVILKEAFAADTDVKKKKARKKLEKYAEAADNTNEKKIWIIINKQKKDGKELGKEAWNNVKDAKDNNDLTTAQKNLKKAIKDILGKEDNAVYDKIIKGISTSVTDINEVTNILNKAKEGEAEDSGSNKGDEVWRELNECKNNNTKVWNAANKLKKAGDTENYPEKIWKKLKKAADDTNKLIEDSGINEAKTKNEVDAAKAYVEDKEGYKNSDSVQKYFKERIFPLKYLAVNFHEKNNATKEEKELADLADYFAEHYSLDAADVGFDNKSAGKLTELEGKLSKLKKYKEGSGKEKTEVYDKLTNNEKDVISKLLTELENKVKKMRDEQKKDQNKNQQTDDNFWNSWKGYLTIGAIALVVMGGIAYLIKTNSSEEGEGE